jgi:hypothetical protein
LFVDHFFFFFLPSFPTDIPKIPFEEKECSEQLDTKEEGIMISRTPTKRKKESPSADWIPAIFYSDPWRKHLKVHACSPSHSLSSHH